MSPVDDRGSEKSLEKICKKLSGGKSIEHSLSRLDRLTQEAVEIMKTAGTEEEKRSSPFVSLLVSDAEMLWLQSAI